MFIWRDVFFCMWGLPSLYRNKTHSDLLHFKLPFWQSHCSFGFLSALLAFIMPFWLSLCPFGFHSVLLLHFSSNSALLAVNMTHSVPLESLRPFWQSLGTYISHNALFDSYPALLEIILPFLAVTPPYWKSHCLSFGSRIVLFAVTFPFWQSHLHCWQSPLHCWQSLCPFGSHFALFGRHCPVGLHSALLAVNLPFFWQSHCVNLAVICSFSSHSALLAVGYLPLAQFEIQKIISFETVVYFNLDWILNLAY
jgi:hypothetical protein